MNVVFPKSKKPLTVWPATSERFDTFFIRFLHLFPPRHRCRGDLTPVRYNDRLSSWIIENVFIWAAYVSWPEKAIYLWITFNATTKSMTAHGGRLLYDGSFILYACVHAVLLFCRSRRGGEWGGEKIIMLLKKWMNRLRNLR